MRDGFIIHEKTLKQMERLEDADAAFLLACMTRYYRTGQISIDEVATFNLPVAVILDDAIQRMDEDTASYEKAIEQRRRAIEKRWHKDADGVGDTAEYGRIRPNTDEYGSNTGDTVPVYVPVIKEKSTLKSTKREKFKPPSVEDVRAYCRERMNNVDAEAFVAFYESKGWKVGSQPMKNWKSAVVTWEKRNTKPSSNKFNNFKRNDDNKALMAQLIANAEGGK